MTTNPIVGMCLPVYHQDEKVRACLSSLLNTLEGTQTKLIVCVGVNGASGELLAEINEFTNLMLKRPNVLGCFVERYEKNIGKGAAVNTLVKSARSQFGPVDFVLSMDSDMVSLDACWVDQLINVYRVAEKYGSLGGIAADQEGHTCHVQTGYHIRSYNEFTFHKYPGNNGVAGGVLLIPCKVWDLVRGYRAHNIYGSDDGHFTMDCNTRGMDVLLSKDVKLFHPGETNRDYAQWKRRSAANGLADSEKEGFRF